MLGLRNPYRQLERSLGYGFRRRRLLEAALTHRSFRFESDGAAEDNQRLEFLGDAVLGFLTAAALYERYGELREGDLTALRSLMTSGKALAGVATAVDLGRYLRMGRGEEKSGGRHRHSTLADALEAVLGAAFLDGGVRGAEKMFRRLIAPLVDQLSHDAWEDNPKGQLQEVAQRRWQAAPQYRVVRRDGPPHALLFTVEAWAGGRACGTGVGASKQEAETRAAEAALRHLAGVPEPHPRRRRGRRRRADGTDRPHEAGPGP